MANTVQIKRGNNTSVNAHTGPSGEIIYNLDTGRLHAQDGSTAGGNPHALISDVDLKANADVNIIAGDGLTGGGTLSDNRTLALSSASIASLAKADTAVQPAISITAGTGLTGGGTLAASRTVALNAASIASLGKADTALQAPGGTTGQILAKNSGADNDVAWVSSEAATAVSYGPQTLTAAQQTQARQNIQADHAYDTIAIATAATVPAYANAIRTNGYYAAGDGGGALYKRVASEPTHAGKFQSADGAWWELSEKVPNAYMFGAVGDGVNDDGSALNGLAAYCAVKNLEMPIGPGSFYCGTTGIVCTGISRVLGAGRQATKITFASGFSGDGLRFVIGMDGAYSQQVEVANLTIETAAAAQGTAISVQGLPAVNPDRTTNRLTIRDVFVTGKTGPFQDGFNVGIGLLNLTNVLIDGYSFRGKVSAGGEAAGYESGAAISYDGNEQTPHHCALTVSNSFIAYANTAINTYDFEGVLVQGCQIIGVTKGLVLASFTEHPHASLINCHINASSECVDITNVKQVIISGNALYLQMGAFSGSHININGTSSSNVITGNVFENLKTSHHANSVVLRDTVSHTVITGNVWHRTNSVDGSDLGGICVWFQSGTTWNKAPETMNVMNASGSYALDQGTGNSI